MGLDIYFDKVKPSKGVNKNSVEELERDSEHQFKTRFARVANRYIRLIKNGDKETRDKAVLSLQKYVKRLMGGYKWYWENLTPDRTTDELLSDIEKLKSSVYKRSDVYFRKVNFVYRFFADDLVDEACVVSRDKVKELVDICTRIQNAAIEAGVLTKNGNLQKRFFYRKDYYDLNEGAQTIERVRVEKEHASIPKSLIDLAEELLPTQSGFFFGSTEYNGYYFSDITDCKQQFTKLLKNWKDDEVVYNIMSW
jgi:hypothetical protein